MGFSDYMANDTITKSMLPNYSILGFGFGGGNQLVPLMHLGFLWQPSLGLTQVGLGISFVIWGFSWLCAEVNGGDLQTRKVSLARGFPCLLFHFTLKLHSSSYF